MLDRFSDARHRHVRGEAVRMVLGLDRCVVAVLNFVRSGLGLGQHPYRLDDK